MKNNYSACIQDFTDNGRKMTLSVQGDLDFSYASYFSNLRKELVPPVSECFFDLTASEYIDSAGIGILLSLNEFLEERKIKFEILMKNNKIKQLVDLANLNEILPISVQEQK